MKPSKSLAALIAVLLCCHTLFFQTAQAFAAPTDAEIKAQLDARLDEVRDSDHFARLLTGWLLIGIGGVYEATTAITPSYPGEPLELATTGLIFAGSGLLFLAFPGDGERLPSQYHLMPESNELDLKLKNNAGELYLEDLAHRSQQTRTIAGIGLGVLGAAFLVSAAFMQNNDNTGFVFAGGLFAGCSLLLLLVKGKSETEYEAFESWKRGGESKKSAHLVPSLAFAPTKGGMTAGLSLAF